jgi:hypothetical protein
MSWVPEGPTSPPLATQPLQSSEVTLRKSQQEKVQTSLGEGTEAKSAPEELRRVKNMPREGPEEMFRRGLHQSRTGKHLGAQKLGSSAAVCWWRSSHGARDPKAL